MIANIEKTIAKEKDHVRRNYKAKIMGSNERIAINRVDNEGSKERIATAIANPDSKSRAIEILYYMVCNVIDWFSCYQDLKAGRISMGTLSHSLFARLIYSVA